MHDARRPRHELNRMTPSPPAGRTAHVLTWLVVVAAPLVTAAAAWLWIELCKALFIPGMFLALPAFLVQMLIAAYAAPLILLADPRSTARVAACGEAGWP